MYVHCTMYTQCLHTQNILCLPTHIPYKNIFVLNKLVVLKFKLRNECRTKSEACLSFSLKKLLINKICFQLKKQIE